MVDTLDLGSSAEMHCKFDPYRRYKKKISDFIWLFENKYITLHHKNKRLCIKKL